MTEPTAPGSRVAAEVDDRSDFAALVLAGGEARRFGCDKTRVSVGGVAILDRVVTAVRPVACSTTVIGPWAPPGCAQAVEPLPREGPLAAVAFGVGLIRTHHVLVLGGDHPFLARELLELLVGRSFDQRDRVDAVVPIRDGRPEPLVACYRTSTLAATAGRLVAGGERRLGALLESLSVDEVDEMTWRSADPSGMSFVDVDTPADLDRVRRDVDSYS